MTTARTWAAAGVFLKRYPSADAADRAMRRSKAARDAGVPTPAVLDRPAPCVLGFERIEDAGAPAPHRMLAALAPLRAMPPEGLARFDPFLRIRPRLDTAPPRIRALVGQLQRQDAALGWPAAGAVHGDFHPGQVIRDPAGTVWLIDLDDMALAPPEADLGNLAAWRATQAAGDLPDLAQRALADILTLNPGADPKLLAHFSAIALVRRGLKLAGRGAPWVIDQLPLRA